MSYVRTVYYHHTDCGGVVYYGTYLSLLEEARTEFLAGRGIDVKAYMDQGRFFVVAHQELDYRSPAHYGDVLTIETRVNAVGGVRIDLQHRVVNAGGLVVVEARTVLAFIDGTFRPRPLPDDLKGKLAETG